MNECGYGFLEKTENKRYSGEVSVDGVNLSPIEGVLFRKDGKTFLWLRRTDKLVYDNEEMRYVTKKRKPEWQAYLEKQVGDNVVQYKGEFFFMRFKYIISGVWDRVMGMDKRQRMNFYVERAPMSRQDIINGINDRKHDNGTGTQRQARQD
jgi:hypothetical protein